MAWVEDWSDGFLPHEPMPSHQLRRGWPLQRTRHRDGFSDHLAHAQHLGATALDHCGALQMLLAPASEFVTAGWLLVLQLAAHTQANQPNLLQHVTHATAQRWQLHGIVLPLYELTDFPCLTLLVTT